jgi:hypothetical protein
MVEEAAREVERRLTAELHDHAARRDAVDDVHHVLVRQRHRNFETAARAWRRFPTHRRG